MAYFLAPSADASPQFLDNQGRVLNGGLLYWYAATSTTPQNTYTDSTSGIANANPIVLDSAGRPPSGIYLTSGLSYKLVVKDSLGNTLRTQDVITGINDTTSAIDQWISGPTPTYVSATSFTLSGDQTTVFHVGRRVKTTNTSGTIYSTISASAFGALTTLTVVNDSGTLDSGLSAVSYGLMSSANTALPPTLGIMTTKGDTVSGATSGRGVRLGVGSDGQAYSADSTQTGGSVWVDNPSRPNLLINPNWQIDQINEGALYTVNTTDVRGPDGWSGDAVGTGVFKLRTLADPDNAARKCLEISCTTADAAIAAADRYEVWTAVEGYDSTEFLIGTSGAKSATVQFKAKSNAVTGVFGVYFCNSAGNRFYAGTITIADTSEHEYSVQVPTFDTTGTWLYTNGIGLRMGLVLAAGSNFQGTAAAWTASTVKTTSSQANFMSANTNIIYLKPIQLIPGALVQAYRHADLQKELAKAQRQYAKSFNQGTAVAQSAGFAGAFSWRAAAVTAPHYQWAYPVPMRSSATVTTYNPSAANANWRNITAGADVAASVDGAVVTGLSGISITATANAGTLNDYCAIHATANARLS